MTIIIKNKFLNFLGFTGVAKFGKGYLIYRKKSIWWFGPERFKSKNVKFEEKGNEIYVTKKKICKPFVFTTPKYYFKNIEPLKKRIGCGFPEKNITK